MGAVNCIPTQCHFLSADTKDLVNISDKKKCPGYIATMGKLLLEKQSSGGINLDLHHTSGQTHIGSNDTRTIDFKVVAMFQIKEIPCEIAVIVEERFNEGQDWMIGNLKVSMPRLYLLTTEETFTLADLQTSIGSNVAALRVIDFVKDYLQSLKQKEAWMRDPVSSRQPRVVIR